MEVKAAVIEVYRSDNGSFTVSNTGFGVNESGRVLVHPDAFGNKLGVIIPRDHVNIPLIGDMRHDYP